MMVNTILENSPDRLRDQCQTNLKAYKKLKEFNDQLPTLNKVNHQDFLPNFIKNKQNKRRASISINH